MNMDADPSAVAGDLARLGPLEAGPPEPRFTDQPSQGIIDPEATPFAGVKRWRNY